MHKGGRRRNVPVSVNTRRNTLSFISRTNKQVIILPGSFLQQRLLDSAWSSGDRPQGHVALQVLSSHRWEAEQSAWSSP